jgi:hypothetical protein
MIREPQEPKVFSEADEPVPEIDQTAHVLPARKGSLCR